VTVKALLSNLYSVTMMQAEFAPDWLSCLTIFFGTRFGKSEKGESQLNASIYGQPIY
jgi:hypothetical protein